MKRAILAPAPLPASALTELKEWLGINSTREDALLGNLLNASLDICEAYTGSRPIETTCEEVWPVRPLVSISGWQALATKPVTSIVGIERIALDGTRIALDPATFEVDIDADGTGRFRVITSVPDKRLAVRFTAGLAADWTGLPEALRQGTIRLAAHHHRTRDTGNASVAPPRAVAALWQPWRKVRLG